jgi:hypothetical protein
MPNYFQNVEHLYEGFEVVKKSITFWDITPCSPLQVNPRFEEHIASIFTIEE